MGAFEQGILPLGDLLQTKRLTVPFWQRSYAWGAPQISDFWDDVCTLAETFPNAEALANHTHFFGAIILVGDWKAKELEILDGQQRIATACILLRSAAKRLALIGTKSAQEAREHIEREFLQTLHPMKKTTEIHLRLGQYDDAFFRDTVTAPTTEPPSAEKKSHSRILAAARKFEEELGRFSESKVLHLVETITDHFYFLFLVFPDASEAMEIFQVLNDRGIGLSTEELVRGHLLLAVKGDSPAEERVVSAWDVVFEVSSQPRGQNLLRHFWISSHGDVKARSLNRVIQSDIGSPAPSKRKAMGFTEELFAASKLYNKILDADFIDRIVAAKVRTLVKLSAISSFPAMLSLFKTYGVDVKANRASIVSILNMLIVGFVRHRLIGQLENSAFEKAAFNIAPQIRQKQLAEAKKAFIMEMPDDAAFYEAFKTASITQASHAQYLLRGIEEFVNPALKSGVAPPLQASLEHISPQSSRSQFGTGPHYIDRLGNLTLIGAGKNSSMKNGPFVKKRIVFAKSPIKITKEIADFENWNEKNMAKRQEYLATVAAKIWTFGKLDSLLLPR